MSDLLSEDVQAQIARDTALLAQAQRRRWEQEQAAKMQAAAPQAVGTTTPVRPAPTPDQIAKHPKYQAVYQQILKQVQAQSTLPNPKVDAERAKKFTDQRIARMIQNGQ